LDYSFTKRDSRLQTLTLVNSTQLRMEASIGDPVPGNWLG